MFEYTPADIANQLAALPPVLFIWLRALAVVNMASILFLRRVQARWVLAAMLFIGVTNVPIFLAFGLVKLGSIPHLIWIPLIIYLAREFRLGQINIKTGFGVWCLVVMLVDLVSIVFDVRDSVQYLMGDQAPMAIDPNAALPYFTLTAIAVSVVALLAYAFGQGRAKATTETGP